MSTYFPGISPVPDTPTKKELRQADAAEAEEARQQNAERMAERWDRRAKYSLDPGDRRAAEARAEEWREEAGRWAASAEGQPFADRAQQILQYAHAQFGEGLVASADKTLAVKKSIDFPTVILPKQEYAHVMSELATHLKPRDYEKGIVKKAIGEYYYTVEVRDFGDYRIIGKELIV